MFISKKKYKELVDSRDFWRDHAFSLAATIDRNINILQKISDILDKAYNKEKQNDQT